MELMNSDQKSHSHYSFLVEKNPNPTLGFKIASTTDKVFFYQNKNLINRIEEHKSNNFGEKTKKIININEIDKLSTFEEIVKYAINAIKFKDDYLFKRIRELKELCDSEDGYDVSLESLRTMFLFLGAIGNISKPSSLTVSESGIFYLEWKRDKNNSIIVRSKKDYFLDYVIFKLSSHINKRIILNGSMNAMDLIDYLNDLNIKIHQGI